MDDGKLAFLDEEVTPAPQAPVTEPAPAEPAPPAAPENTGEQAASPPEAPKSEAHMVPISAILDEREKRQIAQREAEDLRRKVAEYEANNAAPQPPDPEQDPRGFAAHQQAQVQHLLWNERLNMSEAMARSAHGDDIVDAARDAYMTAMKNSPAMQAELQRQANPYGYVVQWHKRQQVLADVGDDPEAFRQKVISDYLASNPAAAAAQPAPKPNLPPSMAAAPSAGGDITTKGSMFDQMIGG